MSSNLPIDNYCLPPERTTTRGPPQHHHQSNAFLWPHWPPQRRPDVYQWSIGECISYDNVGPINPESIEGYRQFIAFRDTRSKYLFATPSKLATRRPSSANHASFKATTKPHSGPKRPTSFTKSINAADTKAPHHTNNGRTPLSGISRLYSPMFLQLSTDKTSFAPIFGPIPYHTGHASTTPPSMRLSMTPRPHDDRPQLLRRRLPSIPICFR